MPKEEAIALFDMDGTLCDYEKSLYKELRKLMAPNEKFIYSAFNDSAPKYIKERESLIKSSEGWWVDLPKFNLGWDVVKIAKRLDFRIVILTKTPRKSLAALAGKKKWVEKNMGADVGFTIADDKGLVYGRVLVDDEPTYIAAWLKHRPRGVVIMPANRRNKTYKNPQVIRYDGRNLKEVETALKTARKRKITS
jgi:5'-nucleotidase